MAEDDSRVAMSTQFCIVRKSKWTSGIQFSRAASLKLNHACGYRKGSGSSEVSLRPDLQWAKNRTGFICRSSHIQSCHYPNSSHLPSSTSPHLPRKLAATPYLTPRQEMGNSSLEKLSISRERTLSSYQLLALPLKSTEFTPYFLKVR
jgi:hypothetical protein